MAKPIKHSDRNKLWARKSVKRRHGTIPERRYFLILCEGEKTEPYYFEAMKRDLPNPAQPEPKGR